MARSASATDMIPFSGIDEPLVHGGDLGRRPAPVPRCARNLSSTFRPGSIPIRIRCRLCRTEIFARLPEPAALDHLAEIAAAAYGAPAAACVVAAPGTQILLPLVAGLARPGRAAIVAPTYSEHARAAALAGHKVGEVGDLDAAGDAALVILTNPNNPDGRLFARNDLIALGQSSYTRAAGCWSIDEAFMDVAPPGHSLAGDVGRGDIVVLRSFGKFFGLAGLRLGFALAAPPLAARLAALLGPWAVSGPALAIGAKALADRAWIETTRRDLASSGGAARCDLDRRGSRDCWRHGFVPARPHARRQCACSSISAAPEFWHPRVSRSCRLAALRPAGSRAGLAAAPDCDGRHSARNG